MKATAANELEVPGVEKKRKKKRPGPKGYKRKRPGFAYLAKDGRYYNGYSMSPDFIEDARRYYK